jgi:hypothetical protein
MWRLARDRARIFFWVFIAAPVGLGLLGFVISNIQTHWQEIAAIVAPIAILAGGIGTLWRSLGLEGRLIFYGLVLFLLLRSQFTQQFQSLHRRLDEIDYLLEKIHKEVDQSTSY